MGEWLSQTVEVKAWHLIAFASVFVALVILQRMTARQCDQALNMTNRALDLARQCERKRLAERASRK